MRITVLAHNLRVAGGLVIGKNVIEALPKVAPQHQYLMFIPTGFNYETHEDKKNVSVIEVQPMSLLKRFLLENSKYESLIKGIKPDVILALGNIGMLKPPCKQAISFQKSQFIYPSKYSGKETPYLKFKNKLLKLYLKKCLKHTQLVFCPTEIVKKRFSQTFNFPIDQIKIFTMGTSDFFKNKLTDIKYDEDFGDKRFFNLFYLAKFCAHKNFEILIDVFNNFRNELKDVRCFLTIASDQHPNAKKFLYKIKKFKLEKQLVNIGTIEHSKIAYYYKKSDAFIFPTLLESFGLPYLEAMYFGTPILTSDLDFARGVCSNAAIYFDPWNADDIVHKILLIKNNPHIRKELIINGKRRVASTYHKSWKESVKDMIEELELLINQ